MKQYVILAAVICLSGLGACRSACVIDSDPQDATVYVDGERLGNTPSSITFSNWAFRYNYKIRVEKPGYESEERIISKRVNFWGVQSWPANVFFRLRRHGN